MKSSNLLKDHYPKFLLDWDSTKNIGIDKNKITIGSSKKLIAWKCHKCGYEWSQKIDRRIKHKTECKICTGTKKLLKFTHPELFSELDQDKNENVNIDLLTNSSSKKVWWKCKNGHSWFQNIDTRVKKGAGCQSCSSLKMSFVLSHAHLLDEWDFEKNGDLNPNFLTKGSNKLIWWKCKTCNNSFQSALYKRVNGSKCSKCRLRVQNKIPLTVNFKNLVDEWDYEQNKIGPEDISERSSIKVYWICEKGHKYKMDPYSRTKLGLGCMRCRGKILNHSKSLFSLRPDICKEWDYEMNSISPDNISVYSNKKAWWKCKNGHSWQAYIYNRTKEKGTTCPICSGRVSSVSSSLSILFPHLLDEWDSENNIDLKPEQLRPGSHKKVWWRCRLNPKHKWSTPVYSRTSKNEFGCPYCSGKYTLKEESLGNTSQKLMAEWDWDLNKQIDPYTLSTKSEKKVWWRCKRNKDHYWRTAVSHRTGGTNCPYCTFTGILVNKYIKQYKSSLTDKINLYYLIIYNENEVFYKIGITKNSIEVRYKSLFEKTGYKIIKVKSVRGTLKRIINLEQTAHRKASRGLDANLEKYRPKIYFGGVSECYKLPTNLEPYANKIRSKYKSFETFTAIQHL